MRAPPSASSSFSSVIFLLVTSRRITGLVQHLGKHVGGERASALYRLHNLCFERFIFPVHNSVFRFCPLKVGSQKRHLFIERSPDNQLIGRGLHLTEHLMQDIFDHTIQNVHRVTSLTVTLKTAAGLAVAYVADTFFANLRAVCMPDDFAVCGQYQPPPAMTAISVAGEERLSRSMQRDSALIFIFQLTRQHELLRQIKSFGRDNLEFCKRFGVCLAAAQDTFI